ncbi:hypothetical protein N7532_008834 [Penicillium argentinense]|uniref:SNF2 family helicase/ATPase n=1 Tax=Penicillium argentinense TaxID=1131581 RepID=A0A9W9K299_9EURO|nr:uncharacterized protein N7532_008834 [Penicillium argentinense]KAJ5090150.1 hypothetical protein N7532_008834 [Penicillium argentinense]
MARESTAPVEPKTPGKPIERPQGSVPQLPEFGKPSPMGQPQRQPHPQHQPRPAASSNHLFNIPKSNHARPEHHRPAPRPQPQPQHPDHPYGAHQSHQPHIASIPGARTATPSAKQSFDPFMPVRPSAYNDHRSAYHTGATPIKRPENVNFTTPRAPRPIFQSKAGPAKPANTNKHLQAFIDLTKDDPYASSQPQSQSRRVNTGSTFGAMDMGGYVDSEKANENIKALLEGAFEDEEEENPTKPKTKKKGKKKQSKKAKVAEKAKSADASEAKAEKKESSDDLDDLAAQLEGVTVNDKKSKDEELHVNAPGTTEAVSDAEEIEKSHVTDEDEKDVDAEASDDEEAEEEEDEEEEEDDEDDDGTVEGLKVSLLPHQIDGVRWMCNKETGQKTTKGIYPKGGILADDMGLGKTVQAIALLLRNNKSEYEHSDKFESADAKKDSNEPPASRLSKSTLVVAPLALIKQWESEILDKVEKTHKLSVCLYHGTNRAKTATFLDTYDVVITTYGTLTSESGTAAADKAKKSGIFSVYWYRIILDEAHTIKNRNAKATQAAYALDAKFRWCLTGTPMQNNLDELQSLIRFLRIKPYDELAAWRDQISRPLNNGRGALAIQRLQIYLKAFMKRRTKDVLKNNQGEKSGGDGGEKKSNGFHIVKREVIRVDGDFMEGEQNFYTRLEKRTENSLDEMMGGTKLDYAGALVLLLRLRQSCNHPDLVKSDLAADKDVLLQNGNGGSQLKDQKQDDLDSVADLFGDLSVVAKKCDVCQTELSHAEAKSGASRCNECEANLNTDFMKGTKDKSKKKRKSHRHRKDLTAELSSQAARSRKNRRVIMDSDDEEEEAEWIVPEDQRKIPNLGKIGGSDDEDAEGGGDWIGSDDSDTEDEIDSPSGNKSRPVHLGDSEDESESESESDEDIYENPEGINGELPSTKIRHLMKILNNESAEYKFIVFSVFTSMLDKIEPFLKRANIGFARYDGGMRNDLREASLNKLRNHSGTRVLLCSLRAGALGLNLTAASRVVILEPFWNPFVEEQAIDRVHRLNQTIDVKIYKLIIKNSVEERIVDLQDRKRELANMTIEGKSAAGKLTMRDMMALFGRDAESRFEDKQSTLDFKKPSVLRGNDEDKEYAPPSQSAGRSDSRDRVRKQQSNRSTPEDSVYGRRW